jgi:mannosylglycoprotein endo-beta-mannosidase
LLDTGESSHRGNVRDFKFELAWLTRDDFFYLVKEVWESENRGRSPLEKWQNKIRRLRRFLRGWSRNLSSQSKQLKSNLLSKIDELDRKVEVVLLSSQEEDHRHHLKGQLSKLLREEEIYWLQRSKTTRLLQGDDNTKYFHLVANGRYRKTKIIQLEQEE